MAREIHIMPEGEFDDHTPGRTCPCRPIVEPGESWTVTHRSIRPGDTSNPVRVDDE